MLQIISTSGISLELNADISIPIERHNPLFNEEGNFFQDITYPGNAGLTPVNKRFIEGGHLVESANAVYELPVLVVDSGTMLFRALFTYKILEGQINFFLKVNWGMVAERATSVKITDVYMDDAYYDPTIFPPTQDSYRPDEAVDTLHNPQDYFYAYFPVMHNDVEDPFAEDPTDILVNPFDYDTQDTPIWIQPAPPEITWWKRQWAPHFKIGYVLTRALQFLGFQVTGSFFQSPEAEQLYVHSELALGNYRQPSNAYLPNLLVSEVIDQFKNRLKLSIFFDSLSNTVVVDTFDTVRSPSNYLDLSPYISQIIEISVPEKKGYTVTLKPWASDKLFNPDTEASPAVRLIVGEGESEIQLPVTTLMSAKTEIGYSYPYVATSRMDLTGMYVNSFNDALFFRQKEPSETNEWPLRLLKFEGMKEIESGKYWPEAVPYDLSEKDAEFYRFLNDSKPIRILATVPKGMLPDLLPTKNIGYRSEQGSFGLAIPTLIKYSLEAVDTELVEVEIEARTLISVYATPYRIEPLKPNMDVNGRVVATLKCVFNEESYKTVPVDVMLSRSSDPIEIPANLFGSIEKSADPEYYYGGSILYVTTSDAPEKWYRNMRIRIPDTFPQPAVPISGGREFDPFAATGGYWETVVTWSQIPDSNSPVIIRIP